MKVCEETGKGVVPACGGKADVWAVGILLLEMILVRHEQAKIEHESECILFTFSSYSVVVIFCDIFLLHVLLHK